jgi:hypothetical protein
MFGRVNCQLDRESLLAQARQYKSGQQDPVVRVARNVNGLKSPNDPSEPETPQSDEDFPRDVFTQNLNKEDTSNPQSLFKK